MTARRIAVIGHDAGGNALGRALVLVDLLDSEWHVDLVAFGDRPWAPAAGRPMRLLKSPVHNLQLAASVSALRRATKDADVLVAVKPRAMSYGAAALVRGHRPLILDIDDLEHSFVRRRLGVLRQLLTPDHEPITRLLERIRGPVSAVTVASRALQRRYGGTWVPHIRDRAGYQAQAQERAAAWRTRAELGSEFVVGFVGTVRAHKGILTAARAIGDLDRDSVLLVAGSELSVAERARVGSSSNGRVRFLPSVPLDELPGVLGACDVIVVPQSSDEPALFQSPARLFDAMAAGRAIVASDVGDAREVLGTSGLIVPADDAPALAQALTRLRNPQLRMELGRAAYARYAVEFGIKRWRATINDLIHEVLAS